MPRRRTNYNRITYVFPDDPPQRLHGLNEASDLGWAELVRRIGTHSLAMRRWRSGVRLGVLTTHLRDT